MDGSTSGAAIWALFRCSRDCARWGFVYEFRTKADTGRAGLSVAWRKKIDSMNRLTAAFAGAAKDAADAGEHARGMKAEIFAHPEFERLEAEGAAERPDITEAARRVIQGE